jgi:TetR/AcrR family transcriptional repressor of mexJK operon
MTSRHTSPQAGATQVCANKGLHPAGPHHVQEPAAARTRTAIVKTAAELFVRRGYAGTSMDLIAAEAGVARQTIYNQFASKEVLFRAMFSAYADEAMLPLAVAARGGTSVRTVLLELARTHVERVLSPEKLALHRLVVAEAAHFPELGRIIYDAGASRVAAQLADFLREQTGLGHLDVPNPEAAAEQFFGMVSAFQQFRALMGVEVPAREIDARTEAAVDTFLRAFDCCTRRPGRSGARRGRARLPLPALRGERDGARGSKGR